MSTRPRIAIVGAGAVGAFTGGHMAHAGQDVTLIDPWPAHVESIRRDGLRLSRPEGDLCVRVPALHVTDVQSLIAAPIDIAFICAKLPDTEWSTALVRPYLAAGGCVVTMQNSLVEERVAAIAGWGRTLGAIASTISVELVAPGHVVRTQRAGGDAYTVFRVGELHGRVTRRAEAIAALLAACDSARVTTNLWGERWAKLTANTMSTAVCALSGLDLAAIVEHDTTRAAMIRLAGEAIAVGLALGLEIEPVRGLAAARWHAAAEGDATALAEACECLRAGNRRRIGTGRSATAQDIARGRWPEIDDMTGYVARRGDELGVPAPVHARLTALVKRMACGRLEPGVAVIEQVLAARA